MLCHTGGLTYGAALVALGAPDSGHPVDEVYAEARRAPRPRRDADAVHGQAGQGAAALSARRSAGCTRSPPTSAAPWWRRSAASGSTNTCSETIFEPLGMKDTAFVGAGGQDRPVLRQLPARPPTRRLQLIDDPPTSDYLTEPSFFSGGGGLDRHHRGLSALLRDAAPRRRTRRRAHPRAAHHRADAPQPPEGRRGPDPDGHRRLLRDGQRGRRLRPRLRHDPGRGDQRRGSARATTTGAARPRPSSGSIRRRIWRWCS